MNISSDKNIVGLTGGIGSGKTTVSDMFAALGVDVIDADIVAREAVSPGSEALCAIISHFGSDIVDSHGQLNRSKLRTLIFNDKEEKQWLDSLLHPIIRNNMITQLNASKGSYCILVAPLLIENQLHKLVNRVLVIDTSNEIQVSRTCQRDNSDESEVKRIIDSQVSQQDRLTYADDIIDNRATSKQDLIRHVETLHNKYLALYK